MPARKVTVVAAILGLSSLGACTSSEGEPPSEPAETNTVGTVATATTDAPFTIDGPAQVDPEEPEGE